MTLKTQSQKVDLYFEIQESTKRGEYHRDKIQVNNPFEIKEAVDKYKARLSEFLNMPGYWSIHLSLFFKPAGREMPWIYSLESYQEGKQIDIEKTNEALQRACRLLSPNKENVKRELWRIYNAWRDLPYYANYDKTEEPDFGKWPTREDYEKYSPVSNKPTLEILKNLYLPEPSHPLAMLLQTN
jgi:hypothetical protein